MRTEVRTQGFDPWAEVSRYQTETLGCGTYGAMAAFVGTMRDFNEGAEVEAMFLEHYPGMTEDYLQRLGAKALSLWHILDVLLIHRVGQVYPGDPIVLIVVWSAHRAAAFDACRFLIEELKSQAPFWKKETLESGTRWVEKNTAG